MPKSKLVVEKRKHKKRSLELYPLEGHQKDSFGNLEQDKRMKMTKKSPFVWKLPVKRQMLEKKRKMFGWLGIEKLEYLLKE